MRRPAWMLPALAFAATVAAAALSPSTASAGGWTRDAGRVWARAGVAYFQGRAAFLLPDAPGAPAGRFHSVAAELYGEVGLGARLELDVSLRWVDNAHSLDDGATLHSRGLEELETLLKWGPIGGSNALAFLVGGRLSLYERIPVEDTLDGTPQRGPGGGDVLVGASFGHSFHPTPAWVNVDVLHRLRVGSPSSGLLTRVEAGWTFLDPLGGALTAEIQPAFGRDIDQAADAPAPVPNVLGLGAKLFLSIHAGFGLAADGVWLPDVMNDGPGWRLAGSVTWER